MYPSFFKKLGPIDVNKIKTTIDCETFNISSNDKFIDFLSIDTLRDNSITFLHQNEKFIKKFPETSAIICTKKIREKLDYNQKTIIVNNIQESVAKISNIFYRNLNTSEIKNLKKPQIGKNCNISKDAKIENGVIIGNNVEINCNAVIKHSCVIGDKSIIGSNTTISNTILGENVTIGSNTSVGQRGFGFHLNENDNVNIFHSGRVIIKSKVSIGSGCTIDRGSFSDTMIGENTYFDNLCHIAHNVKIGNNCAFAAMTGIAGSAKIGNNVLAGGQAGIAGHISIGNNVNIAAKSGVFDSLKDGETVMGNPAINKFKFLKNYKKIYGKR